MTDNFTEMKRLFDAECDKQPTSFVLLKLFDGQPINEVKRYLIETIKKTEESHIRIADIQLSSSGEG